MNQIFFQLRIGDYVLPFTGGAVVFFGVLIVGGLLVLARGYSQGGDRTSDVWVWGLCFTVVGVALIASQHR